MTRKAAAFVWLLLASIIIGSSIGLAARANASPETDYLQSLNNVGIVVYDTGAALNTGHAICEAFNTTRGDVVARNLFLHTTWTDVPNMAVAEAWVLVAGSTLCPWHFHPERVI